jgi:hypothetical protein
MACNYGLPLLFAEYFLFMGLGLGVQCLILSLLLPVFAPCIVCSIRAGNLDKAFTAEYAPAILADGNFVRPNLPMEHLDAIRLLMLSTAAKLVDFVNEKVDGSRLDNKSQSSRFLRSALIDEG